MACTACTRRRPRHQHWRLMWCTCVHCTRTACGAFLPSHSLCTVVDGFQMRRRSRKMQVARCRCDEWQLKKKILRTHIARMRAAFWHHTNPKGYKLCIWSNRNICVFCMTDVCRRISHIPFWFSPDGVHTDWCSENMLTSFTSSIEYDSHR